ncbi:apolipoprotein N-acyltransferase, partial [Desulfovibrio sp. OttesenSCG-928-I05]|nr:apolipoprotein N-acyltransferase [Desulfovibrio sp. OttesenSCG-928-I05]
SASPEQHLQLTAMRAIEQNRFIFRATNTGYSAAIDNKGRIMTCGGLFKAECVIGKAAFLEEKTVYHAWHHVLWRIYIVLPLAALGLCLIIRQRAARNA